MRPQHFLESGWGVVAWATDLASLSRMEPAFVDGVPGAIAPNIRIEPLKVTVVNPTGRLAIDPDRNRKANERKKRRGYP